MPSKKPPLHYLLVFIVPAFMVYTVFLSFPVIDSLRLSFMTESQSGALSFVGLDNFHKLFTEPIWSGRFWNALRNNFVFFLIHMLYQNVIGLSLAALLTSRGVRGTAFFRTLVFIPSLLSFVIIGFIWKLMLNPLWGMVDDPLRAIGLGALVLPWLGDARSALIAISLISSWQFTGLAMILFTAALLNVPDDIRDAASVDGANGWQVFWRIRFPLTLPTIWVVSLLTFVGNFNAFDLIYTMQGKQAAPNFATDIMGTFFYRTAFGSEAQRPNPTMGATIAAMMFFVILLGFLIYLALQRRTRVEV